MATKKSASTTKKTVKAPAASAKKTSTKVTTLKASNAADRNVAATAPAGRSTKFSFSRAPLLASSVAEFLGTFLLAGVFLAASGQPLFVLFGLLGIVLVLGGVSGAHFNPALTIGALATRRISAVRALCYVVAQVLGALMALTIMNAFIGAAPAVTQEAAQFGQAAPSLYKLAEIPKDNQWVVLAAELLGSVILAFSVAAALRFGRGTVNHALTYAGGLYVAILVAGTAAQYVGAGAVMNPAVTAALQGLSFELWPLVIYVVTPIVGAVLGFSLNDLLKAESENDVTLQA